MLRQGVSSDLGRIWQAKTKREKAELRKYMLEDPRAFQALVNTAHKAPKDAYDGDADPAGVIVWRPIRESVARTYPLSLSLPKSPGAQELLDFVKQIIEQFKILVEDKGLWKLMYHNNVPRPEHNAQMLFFAVADAYCKANNIDLSPEVDSGNGPVDFKLSHGHQAKVLVEIKLSKNHKLVAGYTKQLEAYKDAEETTKAVYLVLDVGQMGNKAKQLAMEQTRQRGAQLPVSEIVIVDATQQPSASKR